MQFKHFAKPIARCLMFALLAIGGSTGNAQSGEPAVTSYGVENADAPPELRLFSFLVGKWEGTAEAPMPDGRIVEVKLKWIGRYILDGMAIADELHAEISGETPYLGISFFGFDPVARTWTVEYLNVTGSFLRQQVNGRSGTVTQEDNTVVVTDPGDGDQVAREEYRRSGDDHFTYVFFMSDDGGKTWGEPMFEYELERIE